MANRITQVAEETLVQGTPNARVTQVVEETLLNANAKARVSQVVVEALVPTTVVVTAHPRVQAIIIA